MEFGNLSYLVYYRLYLVPRKWKERENSEKKVEENKRGGKQKNRFEVDNNFYILVQTHIPCFNSSI